MTVSWYGNRKCDGFFIFFLKEEKKFQNMTLVVEVYAVNTVLCR